MELNGVKVVKVAFDTTLTTERAVRLTSEQEGMAYRVVGVKERNSEITFE